MSMPDGPAQIPATLGDMARRYFETLPPDKRDLALAEVQQFVRWFGTDRRLVESAVPEVGNYGEQVSASAADPVRSLQPVKDFLSYAYRQRWTPLNFANHLRPRKTVARTGHNVRVASGTSVTLTGQGHVELSAELKRLIAERPLIAAELEKARADRDFRENAPLDAAREHQAQVEARIRELEAILKTATIAPDSQASASKIGLGDSVSICDLGSGEETCYTLVSSREANPTKGKISIESPTGRNLVGKSAGDTIEVSAPLGIVRYRINRVSQRGGNSA